MHANRNKKAVKRVEKGMMKANRIRNLFAVFAIVLTTFMITTVFSLGINYMENMKLMQVRTAGTTQVVPDFQLLRTHKLTLRALYCAPPVTVQQICE